MSLSGRRDGLVGGGNAPTSQSPVRSVLVSIQPFVVVSPLKDERYDERERDQHADHEQQGVRDCIHAHQCAPAVASLSRHFQRQA
jgi:hypothetical protein